MDEKIFELECGPPTTKKERLEHIILYLEFIYDDLFHIKNFVRDEDCCSEVEGIIAAHITSLVMLKTLLEQKIQEKENENSNQR